jgi:hypothetical protein
MTRKALVNTDKELADVLGVTPPAIRDAAARGKIRRRRDGRWDVLAVVRSWRASTVPSLQRPRQAICYRPWLDWDVPLRGAVRAELVRRCDAAGAEWHR